MTSPVGISHDLKYRQTESVFDWASNLRSLISSPSKSKEEAQPEPSSVSFEELDTNHDGVITRDEWNDTLIECSRHYTPTPPRSPASRARGAHPWEAYSPPPGVPRSPSFRSPSAQGDRRSLTPPILIGAIPASPSNPSDEIQGPYPNPRPLPLPPTLDSLHISPCPPPHPLPLSLSLPSDLARGFNPSP